MHCNSVYLLDPLNKNSNKPSHPPSNPFPVHQSFVGSNCSWSCSSPPQVVKPKLSATIISQTSTCKFSNPAENIFKKNHFGDVLLENNSTQEISKPKARFPSIIQRKKVLRAEMKKEYLDSIKHCKRGEKMRKVGLSRNQMSSTTSKVVPIPYTATNRVKPVGRSPLEGSRNYLACSTPDLANFALKFPKSALHGSELPNYYKSQDFPKSESMFLEAGETGPASERLRQMAARYQSQTVAEGFYSDYGEPRSMETNLNFSYQMPFLSNAEISDSKNSFPSYNLPDGNIFASHLETKFPAYPVSTTNEVVSQPPAKAASPVCSSNETKVPTFQNFHMRSYYQQPTSEYGKSTGSYSSSYATACMRVVDMNCNLSTSDSSAVENGSTSVVHCYNDFTTEHSRKANDEVYSPWSTNNFYYHSNLNQGWPDVPSYYVEKEKHPAGNNSSRSLKSTPDVQGYNTEEQEFPSNNFSSPATPLCSTQLTREGSHSFDKKFRLSHLEDIPDQTSTVGSYAQNDHPSWSLNAQPFPFWQQSNQFTLPTTQVDYHDEEFSQTLQQPEALVSSLPEMCNKNENKPPPPYLSPKSKRKVCAVVNPSVVSRPEKSENTFREDKIQMEPVKPPHELDGATKLASNQEPSKDGEDRSLSISFGSDCFQDSFSSLIYQHKLSTV